MRVAIVSDVLVQRGGGERTVEAMAKTFPDAPIFAILYSPVVGPPALADRIVQSQLSRIPGAARRHRFLFPLFPAAVESFDLSDYDVIVSSHHTAAKGILRNAQQFHLCYCHTPMRALWERSHDELASLPSPARPLATALLSRLRVWDYVTAARVDEFVANSETTRRRIATHYRRDSTVLNPPIDVAAFTPGATTEIGDYYLFASRLVPYKRVDLAVAATAALGRRLVVVGAGPGAAALAGVPHVDYRGHVSDAELLSLMRGARAMIFPAYEDFGMAPVEMMACGMPVVAYGRGGARETVVDGVTGVFAAEQTTASFVDAMRRLESMPFDRDTIRAHAATFSVEAFTSRLRGMAEDGYTRLSEPWGGRSAPNAGDDVAAGSRAHSPELVT